MYDRGFLFFMLPWEQGPLPPAPNLFSYAPLDQYSSQINFFYMCLSPTQILARYPIVDTCRPLYVWEMSFWYWLPCFAVVMYLRFSQSAKKITLGGATWEKSKHGTGELSSLKLFMGFFIFCDSNSYAPCSFLPWCSAPCSQWFFSMLPAPYHQFWPFLPSSRRDTLS